MKRRIPSCVGVLAVAAACGSHSTGIPADADLDMQASDFDCILKWSAVQGSQYRITNKLGYLEQTLAVATDPKGGKFPPGTVIQLVPNEAMVKRKVGWNPTTQDWEFFALAINDNGTTTIQQRGGAEVVNHFGGGSCYACHSMAAPQWDLICGTTHGCTPLPFGPSFIQQVQQADPRCE
jgi:hypothetical protein